MEWQEADNSLNQRFEFADFAEALDFVNEVGELAEEYEHHPEIQFGWGYVEISLTTHSEGGVTQKDHDLAEAIDDLS